MADITTFYPGGPDNPAPRALDADTADTANTVNDQGIPTTDLLFWSGTQEDYDTIVMQYDNDNTSHPNHLRTVYYTTL